MFILKKKYYLIIENIKDIDLKNIKKRNKFVIIYRNNKNLDEIKNLLKFRKICKLKSDGIYLSAYNKSFKSLLLRKTNFKIIGSAHSIKEISAKVQQGCKKIIFSKLFKVSYDKYASYLGITKFNIFCKFYENLIPLGGINSDNLRSLNMINSEGFALMSEVKKKPAIANRLF